MVIGIEARLDGGCKVIVAYYIAAGLDFALDSSFGCFCLRMIREVYCHSQVMMLINSHDSMLKFDTAWLG